ncbi:MAG: ABC transporter ATP-binding protein [Firmicutes bacterium]|nr:ABC transporter ATP-binding protein [Bacillota bacterium]
MAETDAMGIELAGIKKSYGKKKVLENVSLKAKEGSCVGILGGNGCGKSTLLSILAGVRRADGGAFLYRGEDLLQKGSARTGTVGYVPQGDTLIEELTAWDNLRLWYGKEVLKNELNGGVLELLGISEFLKVTVRKMSGGMKKRLSIGCAVLGKPKILLLDEPSAALDLACKDRIYEYFRQYKKEGGVLLMTTHDMQDMEQCEECHLLRGGVLSPYEYDGDMHRLAGCLE